MASHTLKILQHLLQDFLSGFEKFWEIMHLTVKINTSLIQGDHQILEKFFQVYSSMGYYFQEFLG